MGYVWDIMYGICMGYNVGDMIGMFNVWDIMYGICMGYNVWDMYGIFNVWDMYRI